MHCAWCVTDKSRLSALARRTLSSAIRSGSESTGGLGFAGDAIESLSVGTREKMPEQVSEHRKVLNRLNGSALQFERDYRGLQLSGDFPLEFSGYARAHWSRADTQRSAT